MAPFKSLYDALLEDGLINLEPVSACVDAAHVALNGKAFSEAVLHSEEFRLYVIEGLTERNLPSAVVLRLMDHGWGKPVEHVEVKDVTDSLKDVTVEQLEERAMHLAEMARRIRQEAGADIKESIN